MGFAAQSNYRRVRDGSLTASHTLPPCRSCAQKLMPLYAGCHGTDAASLGGAIAAAGGRTLLVFKVCEPRRGTIDPSLRCSANALVLPVSQLERTIQFSLRRLGMARVYFNVGNGRKAPTRNSVTTCKSGKP